MVSGDYTTNLGENWCVYTAIATGGSKLDIGEIKDNYVIRVLDPDINEDNCTVICANSG